MNLNSELLNNSIKELKGILVIEEHNLYCGLENIISRLMSVSYPKKMRLLGVENSFGESGSRDKVLTEYGFNFQNLSNNIRELLS